MPINCLCKFFRPSLQGLMAFIKLLFLSILLPFIFAKFTLADPSITPIFEDENDTVSQENAADAYLYQELNQLKSKVSLLETSIEENLRELRTKDESIKQLEKIAEEKLSILASLQSEVQLLQETGSSDEKVQAGKVDEQASKLEKQIVNLKKEIEGQNRKTDKLEKWANVAEEKIEGMNLKLESLRRISDEQRSKIRKTERALQVAEEEMLKAKLEASSISQQFKEVHQAWLPPWFSAHFGFCKTIILSNWKEHAKPALDLTIEQALEKLSEVEKWAQPHFETFKKKWIPAIKKRSMAFVVDIFDFYQVTKGTLEPHIVKIQDIINPYFQEAKRFTKPHIDHVSRIAKPHVDKARVFLKPYSKEVLRYYKKIAKNIRIYHFQVQATLQETLNSYEFTKPLATEELVWFMASILMALPVVFLFRTLERKKPKKRTRKIHKGHTHRRVKRVHADK